MPPPKKAAKKAAKKGAKKSVKHTESRDIRRAYEHLGRVEIVQKLSGKSDAETTMLVRLAEGALKMGLPKDAADLLRATEHLSFATLSLSRGRRAEVSAELRSEVLAEVDHLTRKAEEHAETEEERRPDVTALWQSMLKRAHEGVDKGAYRQALELARGAEALTHVLLQKGQTASAECETPTGAGLTITRRLSDSQNRTA